MINSSRYTAVVPLSVISNWEKQIQDHVKEGALSYYVYYGSGRNVSAAALQKYDVVITTYQTVTKEHETATTGGAVNKKRKSSDRALFDVRWKVRPMNEIAQRNADIGVDGVG